MIHYATKIHDYFTDIYFVVATCLQIQKLCIYVTFQPLVVQYGSSTHHKIIFTLYDRYQEKPGIRHIVKNQTLLN